MENDIEKGGLETLPYCYQGYKSEKWQQKIVKIAFFVYPAKISELFLYISSD